MNFRGEEKNYTYHLYDEDLPLDLLIELCKKGKVEFRDIFISDITEEYIAFVREMEEKDYENISEFLLLASTLLELKSKSLLPKIEVEESVEGEISDEELFFLRMEEYKLLKEASDKLGELEQLNRFYREPVFDEKDYTLVIKSFDLNRLIGAFTQLLERVEYAEDKEEEKTIVKERFTVADRVAELIEEIRAFKVVKFYSLFKKDYSRVEIINTFLALLEVLKQQIATAEQDQPFGDIYLRHAPLTDVYDKEKQESLLHDLEEYN